MNECLAIDDDDEEDHRWFFSCSDPVQCAEREIPVKGYAIFLVIPFPDLSALISGQMKQIITLISINRDFYGLIVG
jgi:hypothetical protein